MHITSFRLRDIANSGIKNVKTCFGFLWEERKELNKTKWHEDKLFKMFLLVIFGGTREHHNGFVTQHNFHNTVSQTSCI